MKSNIKYLMIMLSVLTLQTFAQSPESSNKNKIYMKNKKVLIVVTSFGEVKNGTKTGLWAEEFTTPYYIFNEKGIKVTIASPKGGKTPLDPKSITGDYATASVKKFLNDPDAQKFLNNTVTLESVQAEDYDAIFYPGGHGPMWDLPENKISISLIGSFYDDGKPVALVCHAPAALKNVKTKDGGYLISGKTVSGFTNSEENAGQSVDMTPFLLEDMLIERGAKYEKGADWAPFAVQDGLLITGQNPASAELVAEKIIASLSK